MTRKAARAANTTATSRGFRRTQSSTSYELVKTGSKASRFNRQCAPPSMTTQAGPLHLISDCASRRLCYFRRTALPRHQQRRINRLHSQK
jgi:hypothetical protein